VVAWVDLRWSGEEPEAVADLDDLSIADFTVVASGYNLEEIAIGTDGRFRQLAECRPCERWTGNLVFNAVNLDVELVRFCFFGHVTSNLVSRYHAT
jgi:hypothetical protein